MKTKRKPLKPIEKKQKKNIKINNVHFHPNITRLPAGRQNKEKKRYTHPDTPPITIIIINHQSSIVRIIMSYTIYTGQFQTWVNILDKIVVIDNNK